MFIEKITVGKLETNCYIVKYEGRVLVIDPGGEGERIASLLESYQLLPDFLLATHGHFDHVGAVNFLKKTFPKTKFLIHSKDQIVLKHSGKISPLFGCPPFVNPPRPDGFLEEFSLAGLRIIDTPGHSPGASSFLFENSRSPQLFSGDLLFDYGVGWFNLPFSNSKEMKASLREIRQLPSKVRVYPGHGESFLLTKIDEFLPRLLGE